MKPVFEMPELLSLNGDPFNVIFSANNPECGLGCKFGCEIGCVAGCHAGAGSGVPKV